MLIRQLAAISVFAVAVLILGNIDISAQGRGRGGGQGGGRPAGVPSGPPAGTGVDRGLGNASVRSGGRSNDGLATASDRSAGRSDAGLNRARGIERMPSDNELRRFTGISRRLGSTPAELQARYAAALAVNPNLTFGNFVAAHMVADNLGGRFPSVTANAILAGLADGNSLGRTLRDLGVSDTDSKQARKAAERAIKERKRN